MSDIVSPLLQWLNAHPQLAGLVTFIISAGESVAIIGTIVPGSIMMTALGTLAGAGIIPLWPTIFWAIMGAIVGDGISYWIGHYFKDRLPHVWPFRNHPNLLISGETFVHKYGGMSVFIGRFVGPVRALVPLVAGMLGMKPLQFTIANIASAILWAPAYMLPGILLGAASLELPPDIALHVILVLLLITLFILLCLWFVYKLLQLIHNQTTQLQIAIWHRLQMSRRLSGITKVLQHHNPHKTYGQLNLAFYFVVTCIAFLALALYVKYAGPSNIMVNQALFHLFRGIRAPLIDEVMQNLTLLGQKQVILPVVLVVFVSLLAWKRPRAAFHTLVLGALAAGSVFVLKNIFRSPRPWGVFHSPETYSMPSGHAVLSATFFFGLAFLIAQAFKPKYRWPIYAIAAVIAFLVALSRLYLGAHWFTDIIAGWLVSAAILMFVIISYRRYAEKPKQTLGIFVIGLLALCLTLGVYRHLQFNQLTTNYAQLDWPKDEFSMNEWWQKNDMLPAYRTSLFGFPSQQINIAWAGDLEQIRATLLKEGWSKPPPRDLVSTMHRISDIKSAQYLPMVSPQYLDKKPILILTRPATNQKNLLVLRLWDSNRTIKDTHTTVWVGVISGVPRSYSWLFNKKSNNLSAIDPAWIFPSKMGIAEWQWKTIEMDTTKTGNTTKQKILLIRENKSVHKKK